jgi:hypothetical protein
MTRQRQDVRKEVHTAPLILLAGIPHPDCAAVAAAVEASVSPAPRVIFQASGSDNAALYREQTVAALLRAVTEYAVRQSRAQKVPPTPTQILLAYVPAPDEESLLAEFDFFVFPVRLTRLAEYDDYGRQHRHDRRVAETYVVSSITNVLRDFVEVKRRLSSASLREPLFLPPRNFKVSQTQKMADIFKEFRQAARPWGSPITEISTAKVTHKDLPKHVFGSGHKEVLSDSRSLLFPHDLSNDGFTREIPSDSSDEERKRFMRSSYRFGVPLTNGYHHDVQFAGRDLGGAVFECPVNGTLTLNSTYANVYPNDYVRPSKK